MAEYTEEHVERVRHMTEADINGELDKMLRDDPWDNDALPMIDAFAITAIQHRLANALEPELGKKWARIAVGLER